MWRKPRNRIVPASDIEADRLCFYGEGANIMKSRNFPLFSAYPEFTQQVAEAIRKNFLYLFGPLNIDDWLFMEQGQKIYSVMNFWEDALRLGGIFASTVANMHIRLSNFDKNQESTYLRALKQSPLAEDLHLVNAERFFAGSFNKVGDKENKIIGLVKNIGNCFLKTPSELQKTEAFALAENLWSASSREEQCRLKEAFFKTRLAQESPQDSKMGFTFCLIPDLFCDDATDTASFLVGRLTLLRKILGWPHARDCLALIGISSKKDTCSGEKKNDGDGISQFLSKNFLGKLQSGNPQDLTEIFQVMLASYAGWRGREALLEKRIQILAEKARRLPVSWFGTSWANHRKHLHGVLESWASNFFRRFNQIESQLNGCSDDFQRALRLIEHVRTKNTAFTDETLHTYHGLIRLLNDLAEAILDPDVSLAEQFAQVKQYTLVHTAVMSFLSVLIKQADKAFLISIYPRPKNGDKDGEEDSKPLTEPKGGWIFSFNNLFRCLSRGIKRVPKFFGGAFLEDCDRLKNAAIYFQKIFGNWENIVHKALSAPLSNHVFHESFLRRRLQDILEAHKKLKTRKFSLLLEDACRPYANIADMKELEVFYASEYNIQKKSLVMIQIPLPDDIAGAGMIMIKQLLGVGFAWKEVSGFEREDFLIVHALVAELLLWVGSIFVEISDYAWADNPILNRYIAMRKMSDLSLVLGGAELREFFKDYLFEELSQLNFLLRRENFLCSGEVKVTQKFPHLVYQPIDAGDPKQKRSTEMVRDDVAMRPVPSVPKNIALKVMLLPAEKFFEKIFENPLNQQTRQEMLHFLHWWGYIPSYNFSPIVSENGKNLVTVMKGNNGKDGIESIRIERTKDNAPVLWIKTRHVHMRHLEYLLFPPQRKGVRVCMAEPALLRAKEVRVRWDLETLTSTFEQGESRVYMSQPVTLLTQTAFPARAPISDFYCGVDVGERSGIVVAAIKVKSGPFAYVVEELDIYQSGELNALRRYAHQPQEPLFQPLSKGATRKTQLVRESLQTGVWNWLHAKIVRGAILVYEDSVGSSDAKNHWLRYFQQNLKKLDLPPEKKGKNAKRGAKEKEASDALQKAQKDKWGGPLDKIRRFAIEIQTKGTSQFCLRCHRWYQLSLKKNEPGVVVEQSGVFVTFLIPSSQERVYGYCERPLSMGFKPSADDFKRMVMKFMFPPLFGKSGRPSAVYQKFVAGKKHPRYRFDRGFQKRFGNSALFVCPRVGCGHFDHKDEQAAIVIALLGYLADQELITGEKTPYLRLTELLDSIQNPALG